MNEWLATGHLNLSKNLHIAQNALFWAKKKRTLVQSPGFFNYQFSTSKCEE